MRYKILFFIALVVTFAITVGMSRILIPILKSKKMGQKILDIGPRWHKSKEGTPTMGGFAFIIASIIVGLVCCVYYILTDSVRETLPFVLTLAYGAANGMIGCIDDSAKLRKKQNEGLTPIQKYLLQVIAAAAYLTGLTLVCGAQTVLFIPFFDVTVDLGIFYYLIAMLLLTGVVNSVNLTDGIDGLASSVTFFVGAFFACAGFMNGLAEPDGGLILLGAILMGGCGGFLVYNFHPARVFMGDTGSLFLGGMVVGGAFMMKNPLLVVVFGAVYILETLSVILQVGFFKLTHGRRIFKMAPLHHHFEKCGCSENRIVFTASCITVIVAVIALRFGRL